MKFELKTERLSLRPLKKTDAPIIFAITSKFPEITRFMSWSTPDKIEETYEFLDAIGKNFPEKDIVWGIFKDDKYLGNIGLHSIQSFFGGNKWRVDSAEIGYWLSPEFHKQGIMREALNSVLDFAFSKLKLHKIEASHIVGNIASQKTIEKAGFKTVGTKKKHLFLEDKWWDVNLYELLNDEFYKT